MARYYRVNGRLYVSVTTALQIIRRPQLEQWRGNLGNEEADRVMNEAADFGSAVHDHCQQINLGRRIVAPLPLIEAYQQWFDATVKEVIHVEQAVWSDTYWYAGRCDLVAVLKGDKVPTVIDLKTSKGVWPDMALQLSAYRQAYEEQGLKTKRRIIVHLDKINGVVKAKEFKTGHKDDLRMFLYACELWRYFNPYQPKDSEIVEVA